MRFPIRYKLIAFVVVPLCFAFAGMAWLALETFDRQVRDHATHEMLSRVAAHANRFDARLLQLMQIARSAAELLEVKPDLSEAEIYELARHNVAANSIVYGSAVAFEPGSFDGRGRFSPYAHRSSAGVVAIDIASSAYDYTAAGWQWWTLPRRTGKAAWTEPYFDAGAGNVWMTTYSVPFERDGRFRGVVTVDVRLTDLGSVVNPEVRKAALMVTPSGRVVMHWDPRVEGQSLARAAVALGHPQWQSVARRLVAGGAGMLRVTGWGQGSPYWVFFSPVRATGWRLAERIPESDVLGPIHHQSAFLTTMVLVTTMGGLIIASVVAGWLTRPVARLNEAARALADGHMDVDLGRGARDEVGELTERFREMAGRLAERESLLRTEQHELGERVKQLDCIFALSRLLESRQDFGDMLAGAVELLPPTWQHLEVAAARIVYLDTEYATAGFVETPWLQRAALRVDGIERGCVEVVYLEERPPAAEGPFLAEERALLDEFATRLGAALGRRRAEQELIWLNEELEARVALRTRALEEREAQFRALVANTPGVVFQFSADADRPLYSFLSDGIEALTGYPAADFIGESPRNRLRDLMHPRDREQVRQKLWEVFQRPDGADDDSYDLSYRIARADGEERWVYARGTVVRDDDGRATRVDGTLIDITERKRAEEDLVAAHEALAEQSALLQTVLANAEQGIVAFDGEGRLLMWNEHFRQIMRFPPGLLEIGRSMDDLAIVTARRGGYGPGDPETLAAQRVSLLRRGKPLRTEMTMPWGRTYDTIGQPTPDGGLVITYTDVTEHRQHEERIREQQQRLDLALRGGRLGLWDVDLDTGLGVVNDRWAEMLEYAPGEIGDRVNDIWESHLHPEDRDRVLAAGQAYRRGETAEYEVEYRAITKTGEVRWHRTNGAVVERHADGSPARMVGIVRDVTVSREARMRIAEVVDQLRTTLDHMTSGIVMYDRERRVEVFNDRYRELMGYPVDLFVTGVKLEDLIRFRIARGDHGAGDTEALVRRRLARYEVGRVDVSEEPLPGGRVVQRTMAPTADGGLVIVCDDVTERRRAEEVLRESEHRFRSLLEVTPIGVSVVPRTDNRIAYTNPRMGELFGVGAHDLRGVEARSLYVDAGARARIFEILDRDGTVKDHEVLMRRPDGSTFWALLSMFPTEHEGRPAVFTWLYDVTERKRAEEEVRGARDALEEQSALLQSVLSNVPQGIVAVDGDGRMEAWNEQYREAVQVPADLLAAGRPAADITLAVARRGDYGPGDPAELAAKRMKALRSGRPIRSEITFASERTFDVIAQPRPDGGYVVSYTDITERRRMMEELRVAKDAAEAATRAKASFLATMSHEIRTPMNAVIGMVDLLWQATLDDDQRHMLRTVRDSGYSLLTIINDILDFSKIEAGRMELESVPMSVADAVENAAATVAPAAGRRGVRIVTFVDPTLPDFVLADPTRTRQILFNLAGNAVKFSERGDEVVVRVLHAGDEDGKAVLRFVVEDEGIGIPEETRVRLFQPFTQAESSTTRRYGGTGLGLSICQRLTAMMNGEITVESEPGVGSSFTVTVRLPAATPPAGVEPHRERDLAGLRVLVASTSEAQREACRSYLERWHARVETCPALAEVEPRIESARAGGGPFDVVVLADHADPGAAIAVRRRALDGGDGGGPRFVISQDPTAPSHDVRALADTTRVEACPLRRQALVSAVAIAAGRASPEVEADEQSLGVLASRAPAPGVEEALARGRLVLVAEDNPTNQDVIRRQLALLGYACEVASDGREALSMWESRPYAVVLTDCHMPEMDGFELTAAIREREADVARRTPILAITANVLQGEAERCIAAGMDDYLAKPLEMSKLQAALRRWLGAGDDARPGPAGATAPAGGDQAAVEPQSSSAAPVDTGALRDVFGDDPATIREVLVEFVEPARDNVDEIRAAVGARSAQAVREASHKLKSSARAVGANALADLCQTLEQAGKSEDWDTIDGRAGELDLLIRQVTDHVSRL